MQSTNKYYRKARQWLQSYLINLINLADVDMGTCYYYISLSGTQVPDEPIYTIFELDSTTIQPHDGQVPR